MNKTALIFGGFGMLETELAYELAQQSGAAKAVFKQAENRLHAQKAMLAMLIGK